MNKVSHLLSMSYFSEMPSKREDTTNIKGPSFSFHVIPNVFVLCVDHKPSVSYEKTFGTQSVSTIPSFD
jgi:hypothetical protein